MAREIERKFLVNRAMWRGDPGRAVRFRQGYLSTDPARVVRVRIEGDRAFLAVKGKTRGIERAEFEYPVPIADAEQLLRLCVQPIIEKTRTSTLFDRRTWVVDEFAGDNAGLLLAEVEMASPNELVMLPPWIDREVSNDPRYFNSNLARVPYRRWRA